jgi:type IV pilus assembly protein PilV
MTRAAPKHVALPRRRAGGFTLIESLVALMVMSIGLLGVAALQLASLQANHGAFQRTQATFLAQDIVDRMRANRDAAIAGQYDIAFGTAPPTSPTTTAETDIAAWRARLVATLPAGAAGTTGSQPAGEIETDTATDTITVRIRWDDSKGQDEALVMGLTVRL